MELDRDTIYGYALRDSNTGSYPIRENGALNFPNGQKTILNSEKYKPLKGNYSKLNTLKVKKQELIDGMLSKQTPFNTNQSNIVISEQDLESEINELSTSINIQKEEIDDEKQRLLNRDIPLPNKPNEVEEIEQEDVKNEKGFFHSFRGQWKSIKKWIGVFIIILVLEIFFGLALWDSLRDQKSIIQVALRIVASAVLVISLHLAERKYKENRTKIYGVYIIFGILSLTILLIGSLVLGYFFPEYLESGAVSSNVFDLSDSGSAQTIAPKKDFVGFFLRYDFMIGIISVLIYMLISFLDKSKKIEDIENSNDINVANNLQNNHPATAHLINMYFNLSSDKKKLKGLKDKLDKLKNEPSKLLDEVQQLLESSKVAVENIDIEISELKNNIDSLFIDIESKLGQYKVDFIDIFKNKPAYQFVQLEWAKRDDIKKYYNLI